MPRKNKRVKEFDKFFFYAASSTLPTFPPPPPSSLFASITSPLRALRSLLQAKKIAQTNIQPSVNIPTHTTINPPQPQPASQPVINPSIPQQIIQTVINALSPSKITPTISTSTFAQAPPLTQPTPTVQPAPIVQPPPPIVQLPPPPMTTTITKTITSTSTSTITSTVKGWTPHPVGQYIVTSKGHFPVRPLAPLPENFDTTLEFIKASEDFQITMENYYKAIQSDPDIALFPEGRYDPYGGRVPPTEPEPGIFREDYPKVFERYKQVWSEMFGKSSRPQFKLKPPLFGEPEPVPPVPPTKPTGLRGWTRGADTQYKKDLLEYEKDRFKYENLYKAWKKDNPYT